MLHALLPDRRNIVNKPLWRPSEEQQKSTNLARFMDQVSQQWAASFDNFEALYDWSIREPEKFWPTWITARWAR